MTHEQYVARSANRIVVLKDGEIEKGTTEFTQALHSTDAPQSANAAISKNANMLD